MIIPKFKISKIFFSAIYLFTAAYLTLALFSYNKYDPSYNVAISSEVDNILGERGAVISDLLIQMFGYGSGLFIIILLSWSVLLFLQRYLTHLLTRFFFSLVTTLSLSFILAKFKFSTLISGPGGAMGKIIANLLPTIHYIYLAMALIILLLPLSFGYPLRLYAILFKKLRLMSYLKVKEYRKASKRSKNKIKDIKQRDISQEKGFILPNSNLLTWSSNLKIPKDTAEQLNQSASQLVNVLKDFGVNGNIVNINQGPVVTLYELEPAAGTKSSRVIGLSDDIARSLCALSTRIATIPGRNVLGIELPNKQRMFFGLKELLESKEYNDKDIILPIILGKDISGDAYVVDLARMPHLLVAGTTGSGKSVAINVMILSLLYRYTPEECKFVMIDPKMLELSVYADIPHLLTPVVTEPAKAVTALKWAVKEMENRYRLMSNLNVRNITGFNQRINRAREQNEVLQKKAHVGFNPVDGKPIYESIPLSSEPLPFIVVIVDEMADLMLVAGKEIEASIQRLAQMARAAGIHIIMATQRPSVDVVTGVIKANFPSRISFRVTSKIDSRTILSEMGAEQLLGMGDMLYMSTKVNRVHCPFVSDQEVESIVQFLKSQGSPKYVTEVLLEEEKLDSIENVINSEDNDLYQQALQIVKKDKKVSISYVQRSLRIGYNRAATIIERMEKEGIISPPNHSGKREILTKE